MKLSVELLLETLRDQFPVTDYHLEGGCPLLGRPLLYAPGETVAPGQVYLTAQNAAELCRDDICTIYANGAAPETLSGIQENAPMPLTDAAVVEAPATSRSWRRSGAWGPRRGRRRRPSGRRTVPSPR